ncbi:MAG: fatty acid desaturase [Opitutales bacterium]|nr:fatty acid desaturase [Opitutales bacterium]
MSFNSLAHVWGSRTYARELSAVDNAVLAFLTFGEGYHNYHHAFAADYRNGIRWWHFDPTKWLVWTASRVGLTSGLRVVQSVRVQKTLIAKDKTLLLERLASEVDEFASEMRLKIEQLATSFEESAASLSERLQASRSASDERRRQIIDRIEVRRLRRELQAKWRAWIALTRFTLRHYGG